MKALDQGFKAFGSATYTKARSLCSIYLTKSKIKMKNYLLKIVLAVIFLMTAFVVQAQPGDPCGGGDPDLPYPTWGVSGTSSANANTNYTATFSAPAPSGSYNFQLNDFTIKAEVVANNSSHGGRVWINNTQVLLGGIGVSGSLTITGSGSTVDLSHDFLIKGTPSKFPTSGQWVDVEFSIESIDVDCNNISTTLDSFVTRFTY